MGAYTQILNLSATTPTAGVTQLSLDFFNVNGAPGAGNLAGLTVAKSAITTPVVDVDGNSVTVGKFIDFNDLSSLENPPAGQSFVNYSIAASAATLSAIGSSTGFSILLPGATAATVIPAGADVIATFNAAINALLTGTVDTAGGRAAIQFLAVDALTNDGTNLATGTQLLSPGTATLLTSSNLNPHLSETPEMPGQGGNMGGNGTSLSDMIGSSNLNVNASQLNGLLRLNMALSGDPAIGEIEMVALKPSTFEGNSAKVMGSIAVDSYDPRTDTFTPPDGLLMANGTPISFNTNLGSVVPNGLTAGTVYYVVNIDPEDNTFQLSATPGGGVIDILGKAVSASSTTAGVFSTGTAVNGYNIGDQVKFTGTLAAGGLTPGATYYVVPSAGAEGTFSLSATDEGTAITSTVAGTAITLTNLTSPDTTTASGTVHALSPTDVSALTFKSTGAATFAEGLPDDDLIFAESTAFHNGDVVKFSGTTVPGGLVAGTSYFVINSDDTGFFQVAATATGAAINITTGGTNVLITNQSAYFGIPEGADLQVGQSIVFGSTIGTGILANTEYFVRSVEEDGTFTVSATYVNQAPGLGVSAIGSSGTIAAGIDTGASALQFGPAGFVAIDALLGLFSDSPVTQIGGVTLDFPSKIAVSNNASSAPQYNSFPLDIPTLNAIGALGNGLAITINMAPAIATPGNKLVSQFLSMSLAQADAVASNGVSLILVGLDLKDPDALYDTQTINTVASFAATNVIKIRDTAANINAMTVEQANNIDAMIHSVVGGEAENFGPQMIDITPTDIGTAITLSFDVAQALANNDMRIDLKASVATNIAGAFGTVTGEDLLNLVEAGIDRIGFDNSTLAPVLPATVGVDPFAGQNVRNVVLSSQDLAAVSKMAIVGAGLRGNGTIDVSVVVDDSGNGISVPSTLITKMGVDRIIADDGNLDIHLNDARNLLKTGVFLGNAGDKSDVNLIVDNDRDFANLKAPAIVTFAAKGVDVISYDAQINFINSLSQSKNLIDTISAGIRNGIAFDLHGNDIRLNTGFLSMAGVGAGFVSAVNNLSSDIYLETRHNLADGSQGYDSITVEASGIRADWIKVSNYNWWGFDDEISISVDDQMNSYASMTKVVAKANATTGAAVLVDMQYGTNDYAATEVLRYVWDGEAGDEDSVGVIREMTEFGKIIGTLKNVYGDFRTSGDDENMITDDSAFQSVLLSNLNKMNLKGIVIDDHVLNDYSSIDDAFDTSSGDERSDYVGDYMALSSTAQSLDIVYALDATDTSSSLGLSRYVYDQEGNITTSLVDDVTVLNLKDDAFNFRANVNTIDRIVISNASDGDMSIDLSEFGVYGDNWLNSAGDAQDSNFTSMVFRKGQSQDTFELKASSGKLVTLQIVGLTDYTQFNAADLKESPDAWVLTA